MSLSGVHLINTRVSRKLAEKCYKIALLVSFVMKTHRYKLPFIAS